MSTKLPYTEGDTQQVAFHLSPHLPALQRPPHQTQWALGERGR